MLKLSAPLYCYLELTPECNNHCPGCSNVFVADKHNRHLAEPSFMNAKLWHSIIRKLKPHVKCLRITGGEPTLHPEFEAIINCIQESDIPFVIFTNGRWHDPKRLISLLSRCSRFEGLLVSLHGANKETHEAFSGAQGSFKETIRNIQHASHEGINVDTNTVITKANLGQIEEIVNLSESLGANCTVFNRYIGISVSELGVEPDELRDALGRIHRIKESGASVKLGVCIPQCFQRNSSNGCLAGNAFWSIDPWGNVRPCNHAPVFCGNLFSSSVEEIVSSSALEKWHDRIPEQCVHCSLFTNCRGGCRAQAMLLERKKDDLIGMPIHGRPEEQGSIELELESSARPILRFDARRENFGYVLIRGNHFVPVTADGKALLDECNGYLTLGEIYERFGGEALDFIASLHSEGFIDLAQNSPLGTP